MLDLVCRSLTKVFQLFSCFCAHNTYVYVICYTSKPIILDCRLDAHPRYGTYKSMSCAMHDIPVISCNPVYIYNLRVHPFLTLNMTQM